ncbi:MAG TPA: hypothetical protein VNJ07_09130, partial [Chitinophagales bacterium]|nr:hypothetical protein [Chitinophagales bacterium]
MNTSKSVFRFTITLVVFAGFYSCKKDDTSDILTPTTNVVLSGFISSGRTLHADTIYELAGKVVVESGAVLTIEPGTIIKGRTGTGSLASALIISRGAKIMAEGTADKPIIMTSVLDNIKVGEKAGSNLTESDREKWGGLLILGRAPVSAKDGDTEAQIEGIPATESFGTYGGSDAADNSGVLKYVSIRHGGAVIGEANEINGLTLGGVGSGTVIDYVEVVANLDDGIELFGGAVNVSNALVAYQGDDAFDIDQNYAGTLNNIYAIHGGTDTDNALEIDGPEGSTYTAGKFTITNGTFMGEGTLARAATFKDKAQGALSGCLFSGYAKWLRVRASFDDTGNMKTDAYTHYTDGSNKLTITGNQFATTAADLMDC